MSIESRLPPAARPKVRHWPGRALSGTANALHALAGWLRRRISRDDVSLLETEEDWVRDLVERS